jgi:hypothetical protein
MEGRNEAIREAGMSEPGLVAVLAFVGMPVALAIGYLLGWVKCAQALRK